MFFKLEIENFHSIRDRQVLDLRVPKNAPQDDRRFAHCWEGSVERVPKVIAVYGANGSGKSNLLRTLSFAAWFVAHSFSLRHDSGIPHLPFNDEESFANPTRLKLWFSGPNDPNLIARDGTNECPYCYEIEIENGDFRRVFHEGIFFWPTATRRKTRLVERFDNGSVMASQAIAFSGYQGPLETILRPNASMISTLAQLNHPIALAMVKVAQNIQSNIFIEKIEFEDTNVLRSYVENPDLVARLNHEIQRIDFGVRALEINSGGNGQEMLFRHDNLALPMSYIYESHGMRQFVKLFPLITYALATGSVAIIDELDAALHPSLLPEIIDWFRDPLRNPHGAQLWMTCQNVLLMEDLSKDEIVFCEKDRRGRTELYALNDIKGVRRDDNHLRKYLGGVYGAVPRVG